MSGAKELANTLFGTFEPPTPEQRAKVAKPFDSGHSDGSLFQELVLAIDAELNRSRRKYRGNTKYDIIAKVINEKFSRGETDEGLVAGIELMKRPEGTAMLEELFTQKPFVESGSSTGVGNTAQHPPPVAERSSLPTPSNERAAVRRNGGVDGEVTVGTHARTQHDTISHNNRVLRSRSVRHTRSTSLDSTHRFMACPRCGKNHIPVPRGIELVYLLQCLAPLTVPAGRMFAAQLRRNDMNTATFDEPRAITVDRLVIEVPRDFGFEDRRHSIGLLEFLAAGILVCLLIIAASLVLGKAPL